MSHSTMYDESSSVVSKKGFWLFRLIKWLIKKCIFIFLVFQVVVMALLLYWQEKPVNNSMFMMTYEIMEGDKAQQKWVSYDDISKFAKQAAVASEDAKFASHNGFDMDSLKQAYEHNQKTGKFSIGGSTISQQLAKNLFLTSHRSYIRKGEEAIITILMENLWDKQRILEVYLNVVEFGQGIYGIEAAAEHYFQKSADKLTKEESALLISMLPQPRYYQQHLNNQRLRNKQTIIMRRMPSATLP